MVLFEHWPERSLGLSLVTRRPDPVGYAAAVRQAYADGRLRPGRDRVTWFLPAVDFETWPVAEIFDVQRAFSAAESVAGVRGFYTCVFVSEDPKLAPVIAAYQALWAQETGPANAPAYHVSRSLAGAERTLRVTGLQEAFAPLLRRAGVTSACQGPLRDGS